MSRRRTARPPRRVGDADRPPQRDSRRTRARGRRCSARARGVTRSDTLLRSDLVVLSPGVPADHPAVAAARARRRASDRRARAGVALAARPDRRDHRHQGQVDDDHAHRPDARGRRPPRAGRRQHRPRAERAGRGLDRRHHPRGRGEQLPARNDRDVPSVDRGAAEFLARSPRPARTVDEYAAAKSRIFVNQTAADWAVLNADDPAVTRWLAAAAVSRKLLFSMTDSLAAGVAGPGRRDRAAHRRTASSALVPLSSIRLLGRHLIADVLAASAVASLAGVDAAAMTRAVERLQRARARARTGGGDRRRAVRQRLEGDQRRSGAPRHRELRVGGRDHGRPLQGRRPRRPARSRWRERGATVVAIGEARPLIACGVRRTRCRCTRPPT